MSDFKPHGFKNGLNLISLQMSRLFLKDRVFLISKWPIKKRETKDCLWGYFQYMYKFITLSFSNRNSNWSSAIFFCNEKSKCFSPHFRLPTIIVKIVPLDINSKFKKIHWFRPWNIHQGRFDLQSNWSMKHLYMCLIH